jgi:hypothetical protein
MVIESTNEPNFTKNSDYKTIEHNDQGTQMMRISGMEVELTTTEVITGA